MTDAILVDASGVVIQVNRNAAAADQPGANAGSWYAASPGRVVAGMVRKPDGSFVPPPTHSEPVPTQISPRQLLIGLAAKGWITSAEAIAAATAGTPPAVIDAVFKTFPAEQELAARITWARMTTVLRTDALVPAFAATKGQNETDVDDFFRTYAKV